MPANENTRPIFAIKAALDILHEPGQVFEVRVPKTRGGTLAGYFNDTSIAAQAISRMRDAPAVYTTLNVVNPSLIARAENRIMVIDPRTTPTTSDQEIEARRWFAIDFDPKRPAGISSTDEELRKSQEMAQMVVDWLTSIGWPQPMQACSGNGWHVLYRVDIPNDDVSRTNVEFALKMLSAIFSTLEVAVDTTVFNAARVWKVYGTMAQKGASTADRPHRRAEITAMPDGNVFELVTADQIDNVAAPLRDAKADEFRDYTGEYISDMVKWLADRGVTVTSGPRPMFGNEGQKWVISKCPFNPSHSEPVVGLVGGRPMFRCLHNSCSANRWKEFREKVDPNYRDPDTVKARALLWVEGTEVLPDQELIQSICVLGSKKASQVLKSIKHDAYDRSRFALVEDAVKSEQKKYRQEKLGDNSERGNIVGLIKRTMTMQESGDIPMFWIADYDHRIRVGPIGDITCDKLDVSHEIDLMVTFHSVGDSWVKQTHASQVIQHLAASRRVNPLKVFLSDKRWDGIPRLDTWLTEYMGVVENDYTKAVGRKWMISAVARAMDPGCQADHMLIFEGEQGVGKSRAARILGGQFYTEYSGGMKSTQIKDMVHVILGKMIVEMSELAVIRRSDIETLKAILTTTVDDVRLSYERDAKSYPRTCVFLGTTNEMGRAYIADQSGARRFWGVVVGEVKSINTELLQQDVNQLWAEAVEAYEKGEDWHTVPKELTKAEQTMRQVRVQDSDPWYDRIVRSLTTSDYHQTGVYGHLNGPNGTYEVTFTSTSDILQIVLNIDISRQTAADSDRLLRILRAIGFERRPPKGGRILHSLSRDKVPHLWEAIDQASRKTMDFPKQVTD